MKTTQAWGWLAAGVLALGLNGSYLDGGAQWAHRVVERVTDRASAVLAQATGRADWLVSEARMLTARDEAASVRRVSLVQNIDCPVRGAMARVQVGIARSAIARSEAEYGRVEAMSAREEARLARREATRARVETARMETQVAAQTARIRVANFAFDSAFNPEKISACGRVRVNVPRVPRIKVAAPVIPAIHIEAPGGPV
ncbi:MAG: hypothetical protein ACLQBK_27135 [Candidatus Sulfotelmatobacter sp.]